MVHLFNRFSVLQKSFGFNFVIQNLPFIAVKRGVKYPIYKTVILPYICSGEKTIVSELESQAIV